MQRRTATNVARRELRKSCLRSDRFGQPLEPRIVSKTIEVRFHIQTHKIRATASRAVLEESDRRVFLIHLCVTAGRRFEQAALGVGLSAFAGKRSKT